MEIKTPKLSGASVSTRVGYSKEIFLRVVKESNGGTSLYEYLDGLGFFCEINIHTIYKPLPKFTYCITSIVEDVEFESEWFENRNLCYSAMIGKLLEVFESKWNPVPQPTHQSTPTNILSKLTKLEVEILDHIVENGPHNWLYQLQEIQKYGIKTREQIEDAITTLHNKIKDNLTIRE